MNGQWIGSYSGTNDGQIFVNIDELSDSYAGIAFLNENDVFLPSVAVSFMSPNKESHFEAKVEVLPVNPRTGIVDDWENVKKFYAFNVTIPASADIKISWENSKLSISWITSIGTSGSCTLLKSEDGPSKIEAQSMSWFKFKEHVSELKSKGYVFRGQNQPWKLRTSFHRSGRSNLARYINQDIPALNRHLSARVKHFFNLKNPEENGAFYNLVQHHGYPTPLLDWTLSPYVAAFFAYRGIDKTKASESPDTEKVRILMFDQEAWKLDFPQLSDLLLAQPHFSMREFLAIENERMIPQQAVSSITNVDDIESYIRLKELPGRKYLYAVDLPVNERMLVFEELGYMGITAGSLFPGLDGACEELKERNF